MQRHTVYLYLETALHVLGGTSTHHRERIQLYLQHLVFVTPDTRYIPDAVDTVVCARDDGWKYHPKHVEQFQDINKLCNVASCWIYIGILLGAHPILHISRIRVYIGYIWRFQWPRGPRRGSGRSLAGIVGSNHPGGEAVFC